MASITLKISEHGQGFNGVEAGALVATDSTAYELTSVDTLVHTGDIGSANYMYAIGVEAGSVVGMSDDEYDRILPVHVTVMAAVPTIFVDGMPAETWTTILDVPPAGIALTVVSGRCEAVNAHGATMQDALEDAISQLRTEIPGSVVEAI